MLIGIDIGGSGSRIALETGSGRYEQITGPRVCVRGTGGSVRDVIGTLLSLARKAWPERFAQREALGIGSTGLATLTEDPGALARELSRELTIPVGLAIDGVSAHLGALGGQPGAVIALGTGAVALGWDGAQVWQRVDGWGHLLGDRGGGAWIAMKALGAALLAHDGVDPRGTHLLDAARMRFGEPLTWPAQLYTRPDRAGVLAAFARDVVHLAPRDPAACAIVREAGRQAAKSLVAAGRGLPGRFAAVGGLVGEGGFLHGELRRTLSRLRPDAHLHSAAGPPVAGALELARKVREHQITSRQPLIWVA